MPRKDTKKCVVCGEYFDRDYMYGVEYGPQLGKPICDGCYSNDYDMPRGTMVVCREGERERWTIGDYRADSDRGGYLDEDELAREFVEAVRYVHTDAWRGYHDTVPPKGWTKVIDTWFCGMDGHNIVGDTELFHRRFEAERATPDFDMVVMFLTTSNVFSTGLEVLVRDRDEDAFREWLESEPETDRAEDLSGEEVMA